MWKAYSISFFIFLTLSLYSQNPHPHFKNYTTEDGLPSPEVHYCLQDSMGYMWFATDNGVSRFDGYSFKNYGVQEGLKDPVIFYMQKDSQQKIWLASMQGNLYYIQKDSIHTYEYNHLIQSINKEKRFTLDFFIDKNNDKYLSILNHCILKIDKNNTIEQLSPQDSLIKKIAIQVGNRWIFGSQSNTQAIADKYRHTSYNLVITPIEMYGDSIYAIDSIQLLIYENSSSFIRQASENEIIGFVHKLFYKARGNQFIWKYLSDFDLNRKAFIQPTDGSVILGLLDSKGLRRYSHIDSLPTMYFEQFLEGMSITHIYQDQQKGWWINTVENGVFYCPDFDSQIYDTSTRFPLDYVSAFDFKNEEEMIIAFRNGAIISLNNQNHQISSLPSSPHDIIYDVLYDSKRENIWMTANNLFLLDTLQNKWKSIYHYRPNKVDSRISIFGKKMTLGRDSLLILGGSHLGFGMLDLNTKKSYKVSYDLEIKERTFRVWEDQQNRIWIGNINGLFEFKNDQLITPNPFHDAFSTRVEDIGELSDGTLVIASKGEGVLIWKDTSYYQISTEQGLTSNMLENIYVDEKDQIWAGTLLGLNKIIKKGNSFQVNTYTTAHGLPSNEITYIKSYKGQLWVATTKGLIKWKEAPISADSPSPIIKQVAVNNIIKSNSNSLFKYYENNIAFDFLTINYNQNGRINYRYRLNEDDWTYSQNRSVNYARLQADNYQFEVQSQNENNLWSASTFYDFEIKAALWQRFWFRILIAMLFLSLVVLYFRNRIQDIEEKRAIENEMNELQRSALRAQMNPHFIFNCLNSIQKFIIQNDSKNATIYLAKFAQLIRNTLNASMTDKISIDEEVRILESYLTLEKLRFKDKFDFDIQIDPKLDTLETHIPPLLSQPYVENAIIHGLANTTKNGKINIQFIKENHQLKIVIEDNGVGIHQSQKKSKNSTIHKGVGMSISQKRLQLASKASEVRISEIENEVGEIQGTRVELLIESLI